MNDDHYDDDHDHDDHDDVYLCNLLAKSGGVVARSGRGWQCLLKVLRGRRYHCDDDDDGITIAATTSSGSMIYSMTITNISIMSTTMLETLQTSMSTTISTTMSTEQM